MRFDDKRFDRCCAKIDLSAIRYNILEEKKLLPQGTRLMAVIKADAYGHGAIQVARTLSDFVCGFGVAVIEEAEEDSEEETEEETVEETVDENEKMSALGYTKVIVTAEEGADLYDEASKESEVTGHLDPGTEAWVILNEDATWGRMYSEDEDATAQYISLEDVEAVTIENVDGVDEVFPEISIEMNDDPLTNDTIVKLSATLDEYNDAEYTLQWQVSSDGTIWEDIENETHEEFIFALNAENFMHSWRLAIRIRAEANEKDGIIEISENAGTSIDDEESVPETMDESGMPGVAGEAETYKEESN